MIAYQASKKQFLIDAPQIQDIIREKVKSILLLDIKPGSSEYQSWQNSIGNAMFHIINNSNLPDDLTIALEFGIPFSRKRIDFILAGTTATEQKKILIVELKQWTTASKTEMDGIVTTWLGKKNVETNHPSYQALTYAHLLKNFNTNVEDHEINIDTCSFLHNCEDDTDLLDNFYKNYHQESPLFTKKTRAEFGIYIEQMALMQGSRKVLELLSESTYKPTQELANKLKEMLQGNQAFMLIDSQKIIFEKLLLLIKQSSLHKNKQVIIVKGGPGTGKSVVAINLLAAAIIKLKKNARYVTKNSAPRQVFEAKLTSSYKKSEINSLFTGSGSFISSANNEYDVLITDEAHRLVQKSGMFSNLGENQIKEIINASKIAIFFIDESQQVTWKDIGTISEIEKWASEQNADVQAFELESQFRCNGSDGYLAWLDNTLGCKETANVLLNTNEYQFNVFNNPTVMRQHIESLNQSSNRARLLAGYCWPWKSKNNPNVFDIELQEFNFKMQWNLAKHGGIWIINPESVDQIGCIHTAQGLELEHVGIIIGPDFIVRNDQIITNPKARDRFDSSMKGFNKAFLENEDEALLKADRIIKNTYRTLMSRGMKSCSIFSEDQETRDYFKKRLISSK